MPNALDCRQAFFGSNPSFQSLQNRGSDRGGEEAIVAGSLFSRYRMLKKQQQQPRSCVVHWAQKHIARSWTSSECASCTGAPRKQPQRPNWTALSLLGIQISVRSSCPCWYLPRRFPIWRYLPLYGQNFFSNVSCLPPGLKS